MQIFEWNVIKMWLNKLSFFCFRYRCRLHFSLEIPMNKIEVGNAPSPNLKKVQSKIGSLGNAAHKPGEFYFDFCETWYDLIFFIQLKAVEMSKLNQEKSRSRLRQESKLRIKHMSLVVATKRWATSKFLPKICWIFRVNESKRPWNWLIKSETIDRKRLMCTMSYASITK